MPKRTRTNSGPARPKRRFLRRRPSRVSLDFDHTIRFVRFLFEDATQGDGRELPFYHAISETLNHFSRCTGDPETRVSVCPQYAFCNDTYPEATVDRVEPVVTRSANAANHQELPEDDDGNDTDDEDGGAQAQAQGSMSSIGTVSSIDSFHASEVYRAPDFTMWKTIFAHIGVNIDVSKFPFAIVEVKPPDEGDVSLSRVAQIMEDTRWQVSEQLKALWHEFREREDEIPYLFVFVFVGKYFSFNKINHGVTELPRRLRGTTKHIFCVMNEDETDFSEEFQRRWKQMMSANDIDILPGFLRI